MSLWRYAARVRIHLRRFKAADLSAFQDYRRDPELARYQGWEIESDKAARKFLQEMSTAPRLASGTWLQLAICDSARDKVIGDIGLHYIGEERKLEIGYTLHRAYHGQGIAQRAARLAILWVQTTHPNTEIFGITDVRNLASIRLLERLGFVRTLTETVAGVTEHHYHLESRFRQNQEK